MEFRSFCLVVVGDGQLGGFVDAASVFGAGGLQDGDDAVHSFDEVADLGCGHALAGGEFAEPEFGGFAAVDGLADPACNLWMPDTESWLVRRRFGFC